MPDHALAGGSEVLDRIGHEGQRAAAEGVADEFRCQLEPGEGYRSRTRRMVQAPVIALGLDGEVISAK